jgi:hypothetical protein
MRRHLLGLALLLAPALGIATPLTMPPTGQIVFDEDSDQSFINSLQCQGLSQDADKLYTTSVDVNLTWQLSLTDSSTSTTTTFVPGGKYYLFVTSRLPDTGILSCTTPATGGTAITAQPVVTPLGDSTGLLHVPTDTNPMTTKLAVSRQNIATAFLAIAGTTCAANPTQPTVYLCLEWFTTGSPPTTPQGRALGQMTFDVVGPSTAPVLNAPIPVGDTRLAPSWTGITGETSPSYIAIATSPSGAKLASGVTTNTSATIDHLTNNVAYDVTVRAFDQAGNIGPASSAVSATPLPVDDFWDTYQKAGGRETGGCGTGAAGLLGLLGAAAGLLVARRRKP